MTNIIIVIAIIAIIALLIVRSRQNKENSGATTKKSTSKSTAKSTAKSAKKTEAEPAAAPVAEPVAPRVDLESLLVKIDLLTNDKEYAKAEGLINQTLKQDSSLHVLYEKLLRIYHAQEDEFAVKQLLETLQKLNLNETYQRVYDEHEVYKTEQSKIVALNNANKAPDVFEFTPSQDNSSDFDSLTKTDSVQAEHNDNTLSFSDLHTETTPVVEEPSLDFAIDTPASPAADSAPTLDFTLDTAQSTPVTEPTLDFKLDTPTPVEEATSPTLDFNLATPTPESEPTPSLDLTFDLPVSEPAPTTQNFNFSLDPAIDTTPALDLNLGSLTGEESSQPTEVPDAPKTADTEQFVDSNDPIVQSFTELATVNPVDLDIELAEQYIRLGAFGAAKGLLTANHAQPTSKQLEKIETLLQKLAS